MNYSDEGLDTIFAALGNAHRRKIVDLLALQPASIQEVAGQVGLSLTAINRHITVLEDAGLVIRRKVGRVNFLSIGRASMRRVQQWTQQYQTHWGTDEETLDNYVAAITAADHDSATRRIDPPQRKRT